jgi:hypothetical protein
MMRFPSPEDLGPTGFFPPSTELMTAFGYTAAATGILLAMAAICVSAVLTVRFRPRMLETSFARAHQSVIIAGVVGLLLAGLGAVVVSFV